MAVLKEWRCFAHGPFESEEQKCPNGCSRAFVVREIRSAPAIKHNRTKVADSAIRALAADFGLTNVKNDKAGGSVMDALRRPTSMQDFAPRFIDVPHAAAGFSRDPAARIPTVDPQAAIGGSTAQGENAPAAAFGLGEEGRGAQSDGRVQIPRPKPFLDPKLTYHPTEMPSAPE